jgi:hypothetical protein
MVKPTIQAESYSRLIKVLNSQSVVESKFSQTSEITEILAVYPQVSLTSCEVSSGRVNYGGKIVLSIVYIDEEGNLCRMQKGAEFTHYADDNVLAPAQTGLCKLEVKRTQVKRDGSSFVISAIVEGEIEVYAQAERNYLSDAEGAIINKENKDLYSAVTFSGESEVEDDFEADSLVDVLIPAAQAVITSCRCGTAEIEIEGEIYLSLFAMRGDAPVCLDRVIPFKSVIVCDYSVTGTFARADAEIKNLNVNATVNEERGKCNINFVCELAFDGVFYSKNEVTLAVDAFDTQKALNINFVEEVAYPCQEIKVITERISGIASCKSKLDYTCQFRAAAQPYAEYNYVAESGAVEGGMCALLIYEQNGEIKSAPFTLPFAIPLNADLGEGDEIKSEIAVCGVNVKQPAEGELEVEAVLKICVCVSKKATASYIAAIEEGENLPASNSAISVYFPAAGDGLWDVAKKLRRSPNDVEACNPELTFPLTGRERIVIYRGKNS